MNRSRAQQAAPLHFGRPFQMRPLHGRGGGTADAKSLPQVRMHAAEVVTGDNEFITVGQPDSEDEFTPTARDLFV